MAKIIIPTPLRKFTNGEAAFESKGNTVKEVVADLVANSEGLGEQILDGSGGLRSFIKVYVGDEDISALDGEATSVDANAIISIVPAIAGG